MGHSMGGEASVKTATLPEAVKELNFKVAVALAPAVMWVPTNHPEDIVIPTFFSTGSSDEEAPAKGVEEAYDKDKFHDKVIVNIEGADHFEDIDTGRHRACPYAMQFL